MGNTNMHSFRARGWRLAAKACLCALLFVLSTAGVFAATIVITNVTVANVTASAFTVLWSTPAAAQPSLSVFADADGTISLDGQVGVEFLPVHTGNSDLTDDYSQRQSQNSLRGKLRNAGWVQARVTGCAPDTTYYFRLTSTVTNSGSSTYPASGPLPSVRTARGNSFVVNSQQLLLYVPGSDVEGRLVVLTHSNLTYGLSAVIGDGAGTNEVFFNLSELLDQTTGLNYTPLGSQEFTVTVLGPPNQTNVTQEFTVAFGAGFTVAQPTLNVSSREYFILNINTTILRAGQTGSVPLSFDSSVGVNQLAINLEIPSGHLTNLSLSSLAAEINPATVTLTPSTGTTSVLSMATFSGQFLLGTRQLAQLNFSAISNQHSSFVPLNMRSLQPFKQGHVPVNDVRGQSGRVVVVAQEPLLEASVLPNGRRELALYGKPAVPYAIEASPSLPGLSNWQAVVRVIMPGEMVQHFDALNGNTGTVYFRALEFIADPPVLQALLSSNQTPSLLVFGLPGSSYTLQYATNLSGVVTWRPLLPFTLSNQFQTLQGLPPVTNKIFYRLKKP